jgi:tetratricopeptide (TPR) repeat protein
MLVRNSLLVLLLLLLSAGKLSAQQSDADLALQYASTGDYEKAVVYFEKWYNRDPYSSYPQYLACLTSLKDFEKAEKLVKKQIKKQPVNATLQVDLGGIYELQGKQSLADDTYRKAIKSLFPDIQQILNLGNKFIEIRKLDFAEQTFMQGSTTHRCQLSV